MAGLQSVSSVGYIWSHWLRHSSNDKTAPEASFNRPTCLVIMPNINDAENRENVKVNALLLLRTDNYTYPWLMT